MKTKIFTDFPGRHLTLWCKEMDWQLKSIFQTDMSSFSQIFPSALHILNIQQQSIDIEIKLKVKISVVLHGDYSRNTHNTFYSITSFIVTPVTLR